jgi:hypothetical protein
VWCGGGRLAAGLTLPRLRQRWALPRNGPERSGAFRCTVPEQNAIFEHAARQAAFAAEHIRRTARGDPAAGADAAWAAADALHVASRVLGNPELRRAADSYDRAARPQFGQIPHATGEGSQLRVAARLMAMTGRTTGDTTLITVALIANLVALALAVAELHRAQQRVAQATAAGISASHLRAARTQPRLGPESLAAGHHASRAATATGVARGDLPAATPGRPLPDARPVRSPRRGLLPRRKAGPAP